ncbi:MAG TPA: glycosyltransferase [Chondromyces sp.]|nr:glycosyltransferase [Chondromyces sp.]
MNNETPFLFISPSVPFRPLHLVEQNEWKEYLQQIIFEYLGILPFLEQFDEGQSIGFIVDPFLLQWFSSESAKEKINEYFMQYTSEERQDPTSRIHLLFNVWLKWGQDYPKALKHYMKERKLYACPQAISHFPLTLIHTETAIKLQLEIPVSIWEAAFAMKPESVWLPACAYSGHLDSHFKELGLTKIFLDASSFPEGYTDEGKRWLTSQGVEVIATHWLQNDENPTNQLGTCFLTVEKNAVSFYGRLSQLLKTNKTKQKAKETAVITPSFGYQGMSEGNPLIEDRLIEQATKSFEMEKQIEAVTKQISEKRHEWRAALVREWIFYLYSITKQTPIKERDNFYSAFTYLYECLRKQHNDMEYLTHRNNLHGIPAPAVSIKAEGLTDKIPVLILSWEYPPNVIGGLSRHVHDLAKGLLKKDVEVFVVTASMDGNDSYENDEGVHVYRTGPLHKNEPNFLKWIADLNGCLLRKAGQLITERHIQLVHAHDWLVAYAALTIKNQYRLPLVTTIHATEYGRNNGIFTDMQREISRKEKELVNASDYLIVCSQPMKEEIRTHYLESDHPIIVIPNGIQLEQASIEKNVGPFQWSNQKPYIFSIGRMVQEKGFQTLIEVAPAILKKFDLHFIIAGKGPLLEHFRHIVKEKGLEKSIHFIGFVTDEERWDLFRQCKAAVFPSLYEPFGIVALEAMASKKPVIASEIGGLKSFVIHEETGLLFQPGSAASLEEQLIRLLPDEKLQARISQKGYEMAKNLYSWERISEQTLKVYEEVIINKKLEGVHL